MPYHPAASPCHWHCQLPAVTVLIILDIVYGVYSEKLLVISSTFSTNYADTTTATADNPCVHWIMILLKYNDEWIIIEIISIQN